MPHAIVGAEPIVFNRDGRLRMLRANSLTTLVRSMKRYNAKRIHILWIGVKWGVRVGIGVTISARVRLVLALKVWVTLTLPKTSTQTHNI